MTNGLDQNEQNVNPDESGATTDTGDRQLPATYVEGEPIDPTKFKTILEDRSRTKKQLQTTSAELQAATARLAELDAAEQKRKEAEMSELEKKDAAIQAERDKNAALTANAVRLEYTNVAMGAQANDTNYVTWLMSEAAKTNTDATSADLLNIVKESHPTAFGQAAAQAAYVPPPGAAAGGQGAATSTETDPLKAAEKAMEEAHASLREMKIKGERSDAIKEKTKLINDLNFKIHRLRGIKRE